MHLNLYIYESEFRLLVTAISLHYKKCEKKNTKFYDCEKTMELKFASFHQSASVKRMG